VLGGGRRCPHGIRGDRLRHRGSQAGLVVALGRQCRDAGWAGNGWTCR
jgi:hypothetical protein